MYVCMRMHVRMYVFLFVYVYPYACMHVRMYACVYVQHEYLQDALPIQSSEEVHDEDKRFVALHAIYVPNHTHTHTYIHMHIYTYIMAYMSGGNH